MMLKGHKQKGIYYKRLFFKHGFCRVQSPTCTICHALHIKKKLAVQTPRSHINPHKKVSQDLTKKKQDLTEMSIILMVLTEI